MQHFSSKHPIEQKKESSKRKLQENAIEQKKIIRKIMFWISVKHINNEIMF
jgi:hypothetical protein